jgi:hypothetical protein
MSYIRYADEQIDYLRERITRWIDEYPNAFAGLIPFEDTIDIDLRMKPSDFRFECPICHWGVTLKPEGAALWTNNGAIHPRCAKDNIDLLISQALPD